MVVVVKLITQSLSSGHWSAFWRLLCLWEFSRQGHLEWLLLVLSQGVRCCPLSN